MSDKRPSVILRLDVDYDRKFRAICERNHRKMVDQVKVWVDAELATQRPQAAAIPVVQQVADAPPKPLDRLERKPETKRHPSANRGK